MNLLCPNCQKMLTVPEEFAGQLMKCPLCNGTFTVPVLAGTAPPPPPSGQPEPDIYSIRHEPAPPPSTPPLPPPEPPPPPSTATTPTPPPPKSSLAPEDYQHTLTVSLSPKVLPWVAPVCLLLIFILQFFDWDGLYLGGVPAVTGNAWYAAFGAYSVDGDLKSRVPFIEDEKHKPGASVLTIFYLLLFFPALVVTVASVVITMVPIKLPPQVEKLLPWRWGIVAAVNLILFLFLGLQVLLGFSLDGRYREWVDKEVKREAKGNPTTPERKLAEAQRGVLLEMSRHTFWLRLVVLLHLVAIMCAVLMFWINQRGTHRPLPKLELRW
jgi:hypothetical protein